MYDSFGQVLENPYSDVYEYNVTDVDANSADFGADIGCACRSAPDADGNYNGAVKALNPNNKGDCETQAQAQVSCGSAIGQSTPTLQPAQRAQKVASDTYVNKQTNDDGQRNFMEVWQCSVCPSDKPVLAPTPINGVVAADAACMSCTEFA